MKSVIIILLFLVGLRTQSLPQQPHIYPPNVMVWPNGTYEVLSQGNGWIHGNRVMMPQGTTHLEVSTQVGEGGQGISFTIIAK